MRRKCFIAAVIIIIVALMSFGTLAYFTTSRTAENVISTGSVELRLHNLLDGQTQAGTAITIMPGDRVENTVTVENSGEHPAFVRVKLNIAADDDSLDPGDCIETNIDSSQWTYKDGYWYYNRALGAAETALLFTELYFDGAKIDNAWLGKTLTMDIELYGVQSENNGTDPLSAMGWPG